tara:strand:+ start:13488 stop:14603 length:1116 start_codon:yes stop_codon:yes gene_type:complete
VKDKKNTVILLCSPSPNTTGGISAWTKNILSYRLDYMSKVDIVLFPMDRPIYITISTPVLKRLYYGIIDYFKVFYTFYKLINTTKIDLIHVNTSGHLGFLKDLILLGIAKIYNKKIIFHFHFGRIADISIIKNWEWFILKVIVNFSTKNILMDLASYNVLKSYGLKNLLLISNPLSHNIIELVDNNKNIKIIKGKILFVGHLIPSKGIFDLITACLDLKDVSLTLLGKYTPEIEISIKKLLNREQSGLRVEIKQESSLEVVVKEMLSSSVFVLPSHTEGFPNVILESMACGCAIVATNVGSIPEMLKKDNNLNAGICVSPYDIEELRNSILLFLNDSDFAIKSGEIAKEKVVNDYHISIIYNKLEKVWSEI